MRCHKDVVRYIGARLRHDMEAEVVVEQRVLQLDPTTHSGLHIYSRLDLVVIYQGRLSWVHMVITEPRSNDPTTNRARLRQDGAAAEPAEGTKLRRYGVQAIPFAP